VFDYFLDFQTNIIIKFWYFDNSVLGRVVKIILLLSVFGNLYRVANTWWVFVLLLGLSSFDKKCHLIRKLKQTYYSVIPYKEFIGETSM